MPPFRKNTLSATAALLVTCLSDGICGDASEQFRVSGIMDLGGDSYRALLEFPNGEKKIVGPGDSLQSWTVSGITGNCVTLSANQTKHEECLTGSADTPAGKISADNQAIAGTRPQTADPLSHFKPIDKIDLLQALDSLSDAKEISQLNERLLPLAGVSPENRISQIDAHDISSVQAAIGSLRKSVDENRPARLTLIDQDQRMNVIYLQPTE
ncbi:MAG: hypothetical protein ACU836_17425 [Gammaproteobacteria bacterium]